MMLLIGDVIIISIIIIISLLCYLQRKNTASMSKEKPSKKSCMDSEENLLHNLKYIYIFYVFLHRG